MEFIRKIIDVEKLRAMIDIPQSFKYSKAEILILPVEDKQNKKAKHFNPYTFYGVSKIKNIEQAIQNIRVEWDRT